MTKLPICTLCRKKISYTSKIDNIGVLYFLCIDCVDLVAVKK